MHRSFVVGTLERVLLLRCMYRWCYDWQRRRVIDTNSAEVEQLDRRTEADDLTHLDRHSQGRSTQRRLLVLLLGLTQLPLLRYPVLPG